MKILHVSNTDSPISGGHIAMLRLQEGLRKSGIDSRVLCSSATNMDSVKIPWVRGESRLGRLTHRIGFNDLHCLTSFGIPNLAEYREASLLHIHCLAGGFFNYLALPSLTKRKPAIYTLHDMWPFTGHCLQSFDCERWKTGCGRCPYLDMPNALQRDVSRWEWKFKDWSYHRSNLTLVAPSLWMQRTAQQSMLSRFRIEHIPFGINTEVYRPYDRERSRVEFGIPLAKYVLFYMATNVSLSDKWSFIKGADLLVRVLQDLPPSLKNQTVLVVAGHGAEALAREVGMNTMCLGYLSEQRQKAMAYSAADLFVYPTRADTFGLVVLESLACGTPVVSFNVGGIPDLVRQGVTGALAEAGDTKQLASSIVQLLEDESLRMRLSRQCRQIVEKEYSFAQHVQRHIDLYRETLQAASA